MYLDEHRLEDAIKEGLEYFTGCSGSVSIYAEDTVVGTIDIEVGGTIIGVFDVWAYTNSGTCTLIFNGAHPQSTEENVFNSSIDTAKYFTKIGSTYVHKCILEDEEHITEILRIYADHLLGA
ncbi:MAG: hypothetical protein J6B34_04425 [Clostridia bacterium]|nr:hypothetical protein [Clostridia bacterium]